MGDIKVHRQSDTEEKMLWPSYNLLQDDWKLHPSYTKSHILKHDRTEVIKRHILILGSYIKWLQRA